MQASIYKIQHFRRLRFMHKYFYCLVLILLSANFLFPEEDYWQQYVHYTMNVTLLPAEHALSGEETIIYQNNSPDTLYEFYLHLYPNAYRGKESIKSQEARKFYRKLLRHPEDAGYINIETFRILSEDQAGDSLTLTAFQINDTILKTELPKPLPPGGKIKIELTFYHKVRKFLGRAGYRGNQYDFAQWYPKVVVYDENGWNAEPFHYTGEFYGEFGTFDVTINVPFQYIVAATGVVVAGDPGWELVQLDTSLSDEAWQEEFKRIKERMRQQAGDGKIRTVTFHAENVHDFAWSTSPDFLYERGEWEGIPIHVFYRSYAKKRWSKVVAERGARALEWLSSKFGRYPYPQLTIVHGLLGGGMEYPMLVMNSSEDEGLILHEVGHIYFYGIFGNNEWKEAWLDEGFTSFQTRWYMETRYGKWGYNRKEVLQHANWLQKHRPANTARESNRNFALFYMNSGHNEPISRYAFKFKDPISYTVNAYTKGAFFYDMLKYVVGDSVFENICHEYFRRWAFKHVNEQRFKEVCEDVSGMDLDWFFNEWLHRTVTVDYALGKVKKQKSGHSWLTRVQIKRKADGLMPVEVQLTTEDGQTHVKRWNGMEREGWVVFQTQAKPKKIILDPNDAIFDNDRLNNGPLNIKFVFEYPNMFYTPRNAYLITWRPSGWYNRVDKLRFGGRIKGRYLNSRNIELGGWFGIDSQELDGRIQYTNTIKRLGSGTRGTIMIQKMEGRFEADAHLYFVKSKHLFQPPRHSVWIGFNHSQVISGRGERYVLQEFDQKQDVTLAMWQKGKVNRLYIRYNVNPRGLIWFSNFTAGFDAVQEAWGSDFTFNTLFTEFKFWVPENRQGLFLRFYTGKIFRDSEQDPVPIQDMFFLDGANPRERFKRFYLRSNGSIPEELHYHLPGGGNLRGYYNNPIYGLQIAALNVEIRKRIRPPILTKLLPSWFGNTTLAFFVDSANLKLLNSKNNTFADAGLGLRIQKFLPDDWYTIFTGGRNLTLRLDFPIWVSDPLPDENRVRFRWVFGFEQAF